MPDHWEDRVSNEQADSVWRKSAASASSDCVEVAFSGDSVLVRHSSDPDGLSIAFTRSQWSAFLEGVRHGTFDLPEL